MQMNIEREEKSTNTIEIHIVGQICIEGDEENTNTLGTNISTL